MKYKISDVFDLQMGKTPDRNKTEYWNDGTEPWISIADMSKADIYIGCTKECISDLAVEKSGIKIIPRNTVIMSFKLSIGKVAITERDMYSNEAIMAFIDKGVVRIIPEYLYYSLLSKDWNERTNKAVMGKTLNKATLSQMKIVIHGFDEQRMITDKLHRLGDVIAQRRKQLELLDTLIKARFVEMFGDVDESVQMEDICKIITDGTHQPPKFVNEGIPFLFVSNIVTNEITYDAEKFISEETYESLIKRTPIEQGDVLLSTVGSYGHPAVVKTDKKFCFQRHIAYLKPRSDIVNSIFLHGAILSDRVQRQIEEKVKGIAQKTLNLSEIRTIKVPLPDMARQKDFAAFVSEVDKSKFYEEARAALA